MGTIRLLPVRASLIFIKLSIFFLVVHFEQRYRYFHIFYPSILYDHFLCHDISAWALCPHHFFTYFVSALIRKIMKCYSDKKWKMVWKDLTVCVFQTIKHTTYNIYSQHRWCSKFFELSEICPLRVPFFSNSWRVFSPLVLCHHPFVLMLPYYVWSHTVIFNISWVV